MAQIVCANAMLTCTFGVAPSQLAVLPANRVSAENKPIATIMDHIPMTNIMPFGMCQTPSNPQVAAATSAAMGVLTPQPCVPVTTSPWMPGSPTVTIGSQRQAVVTSTCQLLCQWGGAISVSEPGQRTTSAP